MLEVPDSDDSEDTGNLQANAGAESRGGEVEDTAREKNCEVKSGEVVVKEQLAAHNEEREIVQAPSDEEEATEGVVFHDFSYRRMSIVIYVRIYSSAYYSQSL